MYNLLQDYILSFKLPILLIKFLKLPSIIQIGQEKCLMKRVSHPICSI